MQTQRHYSKAPVTEAIVDHCTRSAFGPTGKTLQTYFMQLQIPQQDLNCMLIINETLAQPTSPGIITVILALDLFRQQIWSSDDGDIWYFLEKLRRRKNEVFEASITDKTRELID